MLLYVLQGMTRMVNISRSYCYITLKDPKCKKKKIKHNLLCTKTAGSIVSLWNTLCIGYTPEFSQQ